MKCPCVINCYKSVHIFCLYICGIIMVMRFRRFLRGFCLLDLNLFIIETCDLAFVMMLIFFVAYCRIQRPWGWYIARTLVFTKIRNSLGLDRTRYFVTGSALIARETLEFFGSLSINISQVYGLSENTGKLMQFNY